MKTKMLRFGGPGLPPGSHTFYEMRDAAGKALFIDRVEPGHTVPAALVLKISSNDPKDDVPVAADYVTRGQAQIVELSEPAPAKD